MSCSPKIHLIEKPVQAFYLLHQGCVKGTIMADLLISTNVYPRRDHILFWMVYSNSCSSNTAITLQLQYVSVDFEVVVKALYLSILDVSFCLTELYRYTISKGIYRLLNE